jgi:hypothetical protein
VALPYLDVMRPASLYGTRHLSRAVSDPARLVAIEMVHGAAAATTSATHSISGRRPAPGKTFDLSPTALKSLEPFRDYLTIVSNTDVRQAEPYSPKEIGGDHFRSSAAYLTQSHPKQTEGSDIYVGRHSIRSTRIGVVRTRRFRRCSCASRTSIRRAGCAYGYACVYTDFDQLGVADGAAARSFAIRAWRSRSCLVWAERSRSARRDVALVAAFSTSSRERWHRSSAT